MRFSAIHKLSSYLMAGTAFLALIFSGELGPLATLLGLFFFVASWWWEPPRIRFERWSPWWTALSVAVLAYTVLAMLAGEGALLSGGRFLVYLLIVKLCNRRSSKDYQQAYVISFIMLVAGTTLNLQLSYAICFLGYVIFATWALILFHLRREMEENFLLKHSDDSSSEKVEVERILNSRRIVGPAFLAGTSAVSLVIFLASATLFFLFPRIGFGVFAQKSRKGIQMAGFNDGVTLGGHGRIVNDETVVMRIKVTEPVYRGATAPELHWRGVAFDRYQGGRWSRSGSEKLKTRYSIWGDAKTTFVTLSHRKPDLRQEIYLEPLDTYTVFGASQPLSFEFSNPAPGKPASVYPGANDEVRLSHTTGIKYIVTSDVSEPGEAELGEIADAAPEKLKPFLQLPHELPPRVVELAREITRDARGPYAKARAVQAYLKKNFSYTLEMEFEEGREPIDYFLFDRKQGHCEYFSSAMAILLRAVDVPTRNVNGFLGGEWNEYGGYIAVRGGDAHSWIEVYFEGVGWVTWDPTPSGERGLGRGGGGFGARLRRMMDTLRLKWFEWVIEYDLSRQVNLMKSIGGWLGLGGSKGGPSQITKRMKAWLDTHRGEVAIGIAGIAGVAALLVLRKRRRGGGGGGGRRRTRRAPHAVSVLYAKSAQLLAKRGWPRGVAQTPREHAAAVLRGGAPGAAPFAELTELYYVARFAESADLVAAVDVARAAALAEQVKVAVKAPVPRKRVA